MQATRNALAARATAGDGRRAATIIRRSDLAALDDVQGSRNERQKTFGQRMTRTMMFPLWAHTAALRPSGTTHFAEEPESNRTSLSDQIRLLPRK